MKRYRMAVDIGDWTPIPPSIVKLFIEWLGEEPTTSSFTDENGYKSSFHDFIWELEYKYDGKLVPWEIGDFFLTLNMLEISPEGGYPFETHLKLKVGKRTFDVVAYGWGSEMDHKDAKPAMIAMETTGKRRRHN